MKLKKTAAILCAGLLTLSMLAGCGGKDTASNDGTQSTAASGDKSSFDVQSDITVISREDGSGTRGAFIELMGVEEKDADGNKTDKTTAEAVIANKTDVVLTNVAGDPYAIGYISLGSLNDTVKALKVDDIEASVENVKNGTYKAARPFIIASKEQTSDAAQDFIAYILSSEGQKVVEENLYIAADDAASPYSGTAPAGKIVIAGSSSVSPVMEKLAEAYKTVNPNAQIEIQTSDSTAGMTAAMEGTCDIGMASRELKDSELDALTPVTIAKDGIAVIVNIQNPLEGITTEQVKRIYTGEALTWEEASK